MTLASFYLFCFLLGLTFSVLTFLAGTVHVHMHLPFHTHLPVHGGSVHVGHGAHAGASSALAKAVSLRGGSQVPWFNASTIMAFLAWFGGAGYILTRTSHLVAAASLGLAAIAGLIAGGIVYRFMLKLTHAGDSLMLDEDYRIEGCVGTLSLPIRQQGTGEVIFSLGGVRRCAGARSEAGEGVEKGAEVVIERYEKGIAYVRRWEEFTN
ncbi:MAG: NfeD family protein [Acidobacteria bacterium]|nr:NfeD family protein [Acidobacteriota bacterium]